MILLLIFIPSLISVTALPEIDWAACGVKGEDYSHVMDCFVMKDCLDGEHGKDIHTSAFSEQIENFTTPERKCEVGIQSKRFTKNKALIQMQILEDYIAPVEGAKIVIYKGTQELFGCQLISGKANITGDIEMRKKYDIKLFEDRSVFARKHVYCAVAIDKFENLAIDFKGIIVESFIKMFNGGSDSPTKEYKFKSGDNSLIVPTTQRCDPYQINDLQTNTDYHILPVKNRDREVLNCDNYERYYTMKYYTSVNKTVNNVKEVKCIEDKTGVMWMIVKDDNKSIPLLDPDVITHYVYCAAPINRACNSPFDCLETDVKCPNFTRGSVDEPATLHCKEGKWLIDEKYYNLTTEPYCQHNVDNQAEAAFYHTLPSGEENRTVIAECFTDYNCTKHVTLDLPKCEGQSNCGEIAYANDALNMTCKDENRKLTVRHLNEEDIVNYFTCDTSNGSWIMDTGKPVKEHAQVRCYDPNASYVKAEPTLSTTKVLWIVAGIVAGGIVLGGLILALMFLWYHMKQRSQVKGNIKWKFMSSADQIEHCKLVFGKASQSTPDSSYRISDGLRLLNVLLETETAEPIIWEEAYWFILRVQWTFETMDDNIAFMFARYLYLRGKEIMDKHGWLSRTPITQANRNGKKGANKELMRPVGIRLLSFSMRGGESAEQDAKEILLDGFEQLGFEGMEQYPHCGVLWSVMPHCRVTREDPEDQSVEPVPPCVFDRAEFLDELGEIVKDDGMPDYSQKMPDEDVIPEFGSPIMQGIEAIGGSVILDYHEAHNTDFIAEDLDGARALKYISAMGNSLYRNPATLLFYVFKSDSEKVKRVETFIKRLLSLAPEADWIAVIERIMKLMSYFGKNLDAKKLPHRFLPNPVPLTQLSTQLSLDQHFFEEAAEAQKEEIRKWLAARTDLKELKKKPVYTRNPAHDARIKKKDPAPKDAAPAAAAPQPGSDPAVPPGPAPTPAAPGAAAPAPAAPAAPAPAAAPAASTAPAPAAAPAANTASAPAAAAALPPPPAAPAATFTPNPAAKAPKPLVPTASQKASQKK